MGHRHGWKRKSKSKHSLHAAAFAFLPLHRQAGTSALQPGRPDGPSKGNLLQATFPAAFVAIGLSTSPAQWQSCITQSGERGHRTHARTHAARTQAMPRLAPSLSLSPTLETLDGGTRSRSGSSSRRSHVGRQREARTRVSGPCKAM
jgi:hypothetical protein